MASIRICMKKDEHGKMTFLPTDRPLQEELDALGEIVRRLRKVVEEMPGPDPREARGALAAPVPNQSAIQPAVQTRAEASEGNQAPQATAKKVAAGSHRRREPRGSAEEKLAGAFRRMFREGQWGRTIAKIAELAGISRSQCNKLIKENDQFIVAYEKYKWRTLGRGPVYADDVL
jgi:hypothetical protein